MDGELLELQRQFEVAQEAKSSIRLSERNVVELIQKLHQLQIIDFDLLHTTSGKEYITPEQLRNEIVREISRKGRVSLIDLADTTSVDLYHVEKQARDVVSNDASLMLINGEIISSSYWDTVCEEINERLQDCSQISLAEVAGQWQVGSELVVSVLEPRLGTLVKGRLEGGQLYTPAYVARVNAMVRGAARGIAVPTNLSGLWSSLQVLLQDMDGFSGVAVESTFFQSLFNGLLKGGEILGSLRAGVHWTPTVFAVAQRECVDSFFSQNSFISYEALQKLGIPQPIQFLQSRYPEGKPLATAFAHSSLIEMLDASVEDAIERGSWLDSLSTLPTSFGPQDASKILSLCPSVQRALKTIKVLVLGDSYIFSEAFVKLKFVGSLNFNAMIGASIDPSQLLSKLAHILDSDSFIDEVGFIHPSQFATLNEGIQTSISASKSELDAFFWHSEHKLGISTNVLAPLYTAAKNAFFDALKRYRQLNTSRLDENNSRNNNEICSTSLLHTLESELMKHSRALVLLSCDFGTAWNFRKLIVSKKELLPMLMDELLLSRLVLSYAPKSERAWSHRRFVIKTIAGKYSNLQEIVDRESKLVKTIVENSKMNYRAWNHRCWLVSYMSDSQVMHELLSSRDWAGLHVADNSCFHYRARLLLQMIENFRHNYAQDAFSVAEFHQIWKEELDWVGLLIRRYVGREALWLHRRLLSLLWVKHLSVNDQNTSLHCHCGVSEICDINRFIVNEFDLFHSCTVVPDTEFGDHHSQATYSATYITWLAKQLPLSFGVELKQSSSYMTLRLLLEESGKDCLLDTLTAVSS